MPNPEDYSPLPAPPTPVTPPTLPPASASFTCVWSIFAKSASSSAANMNKGRLASGISSFQGAETLLGQSGKAFRMGGIFTGRSLPIVLRIFRSEGVQYEAIETHLP